MNSDFSKSHCSSKKSFFENLKTVSNRKLLFQKQELDLSEIRNNNAFKTIKYHTLKKLCDSSAYKKLNDVEKEKQKEKLIINLKIKREEKTKLQDMQLLLNELQNEYDIAEEIVNDD
jgi:uncharacterized protein YrzB (UPF0473 family)